jgi:solute carrier family 45 protein 1/2/4
MVGVSPLRESSSAHVSPKQSKYTSLASLMEEPGSITGRPSHGESSRTRPDTRQLDFTGDDIRTRSRERRGEDSEENGNEKKKGRLSAWKMMALTVSMGGSQVSRYYTGLVYQI